MVGMGPTRGQATRSMTKLSSTLRFNGLVRTGRVYIPGRHQELILAMIDAGMLDQQIHAFFSQPGRDFNHNQIGALRRRKANADPTLPPPATESELQDFLDGWTNPTTLPAPLATLFDDRLTDSFWRAEYHFHPVGQGMLYSGALVQGHRPPFRWVYDCGSATSHALVEAELDTMHKIVGPPSATKPKLDLVALSHFDNDHISGVVHLLGLFEIKLLLLPFLPLWQRLWIAAAADDLSAEFLAFLIDPAGYVIDAATAAGARPPRIVFVPPSEGDPPPPFPDVPVDGRPDRVGDDRPMQLRLTTEKMPAQIDDEIPGITGQRLRAAEFLKMESVLDIDGLWEFVPYNDARQAQKCPPGFEKTVAPFVDALLAATTKATRKTALDNLKAHYGSTFGVRPDQKNIISLFLYAGAVPVPREAAFWTGPVVAKGKVLILTSDATALAADRFALLFTGDGSLDTKPRRDAFEAFFKPYNRLARSSVFQVMHHGAKGNSSPEVATLVEPRASIFCSDPLNGNKHPHAEVLRDFWQYNCIQVDAKQGWGAIVLFEF